MDKNEIVDMIRNEEYEDAREAVLENIQECFREIDELKLILKFIEKSEKTEDQAIPASPILAELHAINPNIRVDGWLNKLGRNVASKFRR